MIAIKNIFPGWRALSFLTIGLIGVVSQADKYAVHAEEIDATQYVEIAATGTLSEMTAALAKLPPERARVMRYAGGETLLHAAALNATRGEMIFYLAGRGFDINAQDDQGRTPLYVAIDNDHLSVTRVLVSFGASLDIATVSGISPRDLCRTIREDGRQTESCLTIEGLPSRDIAHGEEIDAIKFAEIAASGTASQLAAALYNLPVESVRDMRFNGGRTLLHAAVLNETRPEMIVYLVGEGFDVNARDDQGRTPLFVALNNDHVTITQVLVNFGASPDIETISGRGPRDLCETVRKDNLKNASCVVIEGLD